VTAAGVTPLSQCPPLAGKNLLLASHPLQSLGQARAQLCTSGVGLAAASYSWELCSPGEGRKGEVAQPVGQLQEGQAGLVSPVPLGTSVLHSTVPAGTGRGGGRASTSPGGDAAFSTGICWECCPTTRVPQPLADLWFPFPPLLLSSPSYSSTASALPSSSQRQLPLGGSVGAGVFPAIMSEG
jgi:hypothetical protein